jgi:hypothetical protein
VTGFGRQPRIVSYPWRRMAVVAVVLLAFAAWDFSYADTTGIVFGIVFGVVGIGQTAMAVRSYRRSH